jgi:thymidylate synthase (FAD)
VTDVRFRSDVSVTLIDSMGSDQRICQAARVSTQGAESYETGEAAGLINFLARERHGSPFEHVLFQWLIEAPIFVWREFMRHRIASYNEESGRYKQLEPVFYVPDAERPLVQIGKTGNYEFIPGTPGAVRVHSRIN